jgi:hypothetical protein
MSLTDYVWKTLKPSTHEVASVLPRSRVSGHDRVARDDFKWSPLLSDTQIRLLKINPGGPEDTVSVSLRNVDLDDKLDFTALSYTCRRQRTAYQWVRDTAKDMLIRSWKQKSLQRPNISQKPETVSTEFILCNGENLLVTPAVHEVLIALREKRSKSEYWIDGICIHQRHV